MDLMISWKEITIFGSHTKMALFFCLAGVCDQKLIYKKRPVRAFFILLRIVCLWSSIAGSFLRKRKWHGGKQSI